MEEAMRFAQVIVDVPARETDRPFDYIVPNRWKEWIDIGSRVTVPFGSRKLQGFVIGFVDRPETDIGKLKEILAVLDMQPPLTRELVDLSAWMSRTYICPQIAALQVMLPGALKAKYERVVTVAEDIAQHALLAEVEARIVDYVRTKRRISGEALQRHFSSYGQQIKQLLQEGILEEVQTIKDQSAGKKRLTVVPPADPSILHAALAQISKRAERQKEVLEFLIREPRPIRLHELTAQLNISSSTIKALASKGWVTIQEMEVLRDPYAGREFAKTEAPELTAQQKQALAPIREQLNSKEYGAFLLHGVTGSGKTEVYLQAIAQCLQLGREAIVLVPEISLTPQMVERFKSRFGDSVAVMHSRLSLGERYDEWRRIVRRKAKVVVGARSAVFAPFTNLGLIILDEEHESSYKQEESPKYHAKEVALERAMRFGASVILGSATPSLESFREAKEGHLRLLEMPSRVEGRLLPSVQIVDMREELRAGNRSMFSRPLHEAIEERLERREQMVLLLNRRGYSTFVMCRSCGYAVGCPHCDITLTYHRHSHMMRCHYCGYAEREVSVCPQCSSEYIRYFGTGTQRVEEELKQTFPGIRVIRMDVDTTSTKGAHEKWLTQFRKHEADVLLGTQMVAKGLDFPDVTLVGVIAADTVLNLPDFRAAERTFQLLTQVAGRAGRHELPGEVVVQTYNPEHYSIIYASQHDYRNFADQELRLRAQLEYPPYSKLILLTLSHEQVPLLVKLGEQIASELKLKLHQSAWGDVRGKFEVLGPVASPIPRIKDRYRFQCVVKYSEGLSVIPSIREVIHQFTDIVRQHKIQISIDVDPQMLM